MRIILFGIITLLTIACNKKPKAEFSLIGKTNGLKDGTSLYLELDNEIIDSTEIKNNAFVFNTEISKSPLEVILRTNDFSQYRFVWLENNQMTFDATNTDFKNAKVLGSETENLSTTLGQKLDTIPRSKRHKYRADFITENPDKLYSAYLLSFYATSWGKEKTTELYNNLSDKNKDSEFGKNALRYIKLNKDPKIGEKYVDFGMTDIKGKKRRLSEFDGKLVLLEFWASNCGPCRKENPNLVKTYNDFKNKGFEIFAVSEDIKRESWIKAIENDKLPWLQLSDLSKNNTASLIYGINGIPDNFLIDQHGTIIARNLRGEKLNEKLKELLK
ncbi:TlpA disulfide reductase family protein [Robertkochia sediminum]|uniref:TlpA disulfide reductase family protein n=1 Tax=Robertkochia sediminum TaxID=2785326 RepID=UPI0019311C80|nr:TlpA disulfide reductase family protein [Robertkochia sediminum]MBL7471226.1 AhpC/TSA family protein [Robertkochia sediminum]